MLTSKDRRPAPKSARKKGTEAPRRAERYAPSRPLADVRATGEGASVYDVAERFDVNVRTALRHLRALQIAGEPRYVERVMWHPTQKFRRTASGLEMTMEVRGTMELVTWVLGFGEAAVVEESIELRAAVAARFEHAVARYR